MGGTLGQPALNMPEKKLMIPPPEEPGPPQVQEASSSFEMKIFQSAREGQMEGPRGSEGPEQGRSQGCEDCGWKWASDF